MGTLTSKKTSQIISRAFKACIVWPWPLRNDSDIPRVFMLCFSSLHWNSFNVPCNKCVTLCGETSDNIISKKMSEINVQDKKPRRAKEDGLCDDVPSQHLAERLWPAPHCLVSWLSLPSLGLTLPNLLKQRQWPLPKSSLNWKSL